MGSILSPEPMSVDIVMCADRTAGIAIMLSISVTGGDGGFLPTDPLSNRPQFPG